jgi:hypothetical protein
VEFTGFNNTAGVAGTNKGRIERVAVYGSITGALNYAGGIAGTAYRSSVISRCVNYAAVTAYGNLGTGGIAGLFSGRMEYSANYGDVKCLIETSVALKMAGGLLGSPFDDGAKYEIFSCCNAGSVAAPASADDSGLGGLLGEMGFFGLGSDPLSGVDVRPTVVSCFNYGTVTYKNDALGAAISGERINYNTVGYVNAANVSDIYYLDSSGAKRFYGTAGAESAADKFVLQTADQFADGTVLAALLAAPGGAGEWVQGGLYPELKAFSDMTPPRLEAEGAARAGAAAASVTFTSGEDGEYYYAIAPAGAYVVYVAVKDELGNESVYDIAIPAYTVPGGEDGSSGGCDAGLSGLALAVLALALCAGQRAKRTKGR